MDQIISPSLADAVIHMGKICGLRGWLPATSGNFSVRSKADHMVITASGGDKARLTPDDLIELALDAPDHPRASAEAPLHGAIYRARPEACAIAHVHAQSAVLASLVFQSDGAVILHGLELQKALSGIKTHDSTIRIPIFANDQDMTALGQRAYSVLDGADRAYGLLLAGHGLYAFGPDADAALRHVEALDALFRTQLALKGIPA
jgi:methylthioribulose-1-phosphate dehydratase